MKLTPQQVDAIYELTNEIDPGQADQVDVNLVWPHPNPLGIVYLRFNEADAYHRINTIGEVEPRAVAAARPGEEQPNG